MADNINSLDVRKIFIEFFYKDKYSKLLNDKNLLINELNDNKDKYSDLLNKHNKLVNENNDYKNKYRNLLKE